MAEKHEPPSLDELQQKIAAARASNDPETRYSSSGKGNSAGLRSGTELFAGVAVGGFLGYQADEWLGTRPALTIAGIFLGLAGGVMNIYRAVSSEATQEAETPSGVTGAPKTAINDYDRIRDDSE